MAQEYLPAPSNIRLADLMKEHNISQPELAKELGCSKSTINRFISGAKGTLTHPLFSALYPSFWHDKRPPVLSIRGASPFFLLW